MFKKCNLKITKSKNYHNEVLYKFIPSVKANNLKELKRYTLGTENIAITEPSTPEIYYLRYWRK